MNRTAIEVMGDSMKRIIFVLTFVIAASLVIDASAVPPLFKQRKYYGPIPFNAISLSIGFMDGPTAEYLIEHLNWWTIERNGYDEWEDFTTSPFTRVGYERQMTPNHFFRTSISFGYLTGKSQGEYIASVTQADTLANIALDIDRELAVYLFQLEAGFAYYFISPEPFALRRSGILGSHPRGQAPDKQLHRGQPLLQSGRNDFPGELRGGLSHGIRYAILHHQQILRSNGGKIPTGPE